MQKTIHNINLKVANLAGVLNVFFVLVLLIWLIVSPFALVSMSGREWDVGSLIGLFVLSFVSLLPVLFLCCFGAQLTVMRELLEEWKRQQRT